MLVPCVFAGVIPWWITQWRFQPAFLGLEWLRPVAILFADWRLLPYGALFWLAYHLFVLTYEEPTLAATFNAAYERYRANVPRWLPRLTPWRVP